MDLTSGPSIELLDERLLPADDDTLWAPAASRRPVVERLEESSPVAASAVRRIGSWIDRVGSPGVAVSADPKVNSIVRRIVWEPYERTGERLAAYVPRARQGLRGLDAVAPTPPTWLAELAVGRALPRYPVRLTLERWSRNRCALTMEITTSSRALFVGRRRYFPAAHDALQALLTCVGSPVHPRLPTRSPVS